MRLGVNTREGLVIHTVGYEDGGCTRPKAHRLSLAEPVSPYRDPWSDHRGAFRTGLAGFLAGHCRRPFAQGFAVSTTRTIA